MNKTRFSAIIALVLLVAFSFDALFVSCSTSPATTADTTRQSLIDITNLYLDALVDNDPAKLPVSSNVRFTENGNETKLGEGLWQTATGITYRQYFVDTTAGQMLLFGVVDEDGTLANLMVRLKVADNKIEEIETIVCRKGKSSVASPESLVTPRPIYDQIVPRSQRYPHDKMIAIANSYFDGIEQKSAKRARFTHPATGQKMDSRLPTILSTNCSHGRGFTDENVYLYRQSKRPPLFRY